MNKRDAKKQETKVRSMLRDDQFCQDHIDWYEKANEVGAVDTLLYITATELLKLRKGKRDGASRKA